MSANLKHMAKSALDLGKLKDCGDSCFHYLDSAYEVQTIYTILKSCTCRGFADKAVCHHLIAACMQLKLDLHGLVKTSDLNTFKTRRQIKNLLSKPTKISKNKRLTVFMNFKRKMVYNFQIFLLHLLI